MGAKDNLGTAGDPLELVITRVFDAPRSLVFRAWAEPKHLMNWWGPRGFSLPSCEIDFRSGGRYRFHMQGADGDHWTQGVFREVVEPSRIVMAGSWVDAQGNATGPITVATITFEENNGKTTLTLRQTGFETSTARDAHRGGWTSSIERLAEYLATV